MEYAFLARLVPECMEQCVRENSINNMEDAANALEWHIYNGLCANAGVPVRIINVLPVGSYPEYYKRMRINESAFETPYCGNNVNVGFCNIKGLKKRSQLKNIYKALYKWCRGSAEPKTLFVYSVSAPLIGAAARLRKKYPALKVVPIVADLPEMSSLSSHKTAIRKIYEKMLANKSYSSLDAVSGYVLLTRYMSEKLKNRPFIVTEGIATVSDSTDRYEPDRTKTVLYTGTLHKRFGVINLLNAFLKIPDDDYRLVICGIGDSECEVLAAAEKDKRIVYRGQLKREEILKLQRSATVLVNPRQNTEVFTKYSFPSKLMEYLSSGTPTVAYKLDGVPDEYDKYIRYVSDGSPEALAEAITKVCEMPQANREEIGMSAKQFVTRNKNELVQTEKILNFANRL